MKAVSLKELIAKQTAETKIIQTGMETITGVTTTEKSTTVTFARPYKTAPAVVACLSAGSYNRRFHISNVTATGFTIVTALLSGTSAASCWVNWIAVGGYCVTSVFSRLSAIFKKIGGGVDEGGKNKSTDCEDPRQAHDRNSDRDVRPRSHYIYRGHNRLNGNDKIHIYRKNRIYSDRISCFIRKFERCRISAIYERLYGIRSNYQRTKRSVQRYILGVLDSDLQKIITISERRWAA